MRSMLTINHRVEQKQYAANSHIRESVIIRKISCCQARHAQSPGVSHSASCFVQFLWNDTVPAIKLNVTLLSIYDLIQHRLAWRGIVLKRSELQVEQVTSVKNMIGDINELRDGAVVLGIVRVLPECVVAE